MTDLPTYVLEREFDAPRESVWRGWTDPQMVSHWYGPNVETITHELNPVVGGRWRCEMVLGEFSNYQLSEYIEAENACFAGAIDGMGQGWSKGMDMVAEMLAEG